MQSGPALQTAKAAKHRLCILQVPVVLRRCRYGRESKLRTIRDGLRHLEYILKKGSRKMNRELKKRNGFGHSVWLRHC